MADVNGEINWGALNTRSCLLCGKAALHVQRRNLALIDASCHRVLTDVPALWAKGSSASEMGR
jgi:hypothetical protein